MQRSACYLLCAISFVGGVTSLHAQESAPKVRRLWPEPLPGQYIVVLHDSLAERASAAAASELVARHGGVRRHVYTRALKGFSARMTEQQAARLSADPRVAFVEQDATARATAVQAPPSWNLDRIDQRFLPLDGKYVYESQGAGVNVYVIDSGIRTTHVDFEDRAFGAYSTLDDQGGAVDCTGHGTGVASVVAGVAHGVAKQAFVHSVRVLNCLNMAPWSDVIAALDWVTANHLKPAVVNLSLGGGRSFAVEAAIKRLIQAGVTVVGAAGNDQTDACAMTPGGVTEALIVGNANENDMRQWDSNYGACVDLFGPGTNVITASSSEDTALATSYGTSFAAPHVTGAAALYLERRPTATAVDVTLAVLSSATSGALTALPAQTQNLILYTSGLGDRTPPTITLVTPQRETTTNGVVPISVEAWDNVYVQFINFYVNEVLVGTDTTEPFSMEWDTRTVADGTYQVSAEAVDVGGNVSRSEFRTIMVTNSTPGWESRNLVVNGDFETGNTLGWMSDREMMFSVDRNLQPRSGAHNAACFHQLHNGAACAIVQNVHIPVAGAYLVTIYAKADREGAWAGASLLRNGAGVQTFAEPVGFRSEYWGPDVEYPYFKYERSILAQAGDVLRVWGYSPSTPGWLVLDDVSVVKQ